MIATVSVAVPADTGSVVSADGHAGARPVPGLRTPPPLEPRYDDENPTGGCPATGELLPFAQPVPHGFDRDARLVAPGPTARRLPDPGPWAVQFLRAALEMLAGRRPVDQLRCWATLPAVAGLRSATRPGPARTGPTERTGRTGRGGRGGRYVPTGPTIGTAQAGCLAGPPDALHSVHVSEPAEGVAEVCAVVRQGQRYHALAARMEGLDGRWRCVSFRLL